MAATYCGNQCDSCLHRETLGCPGCKQGPGKLYSGDCELAKCCREKGHQECTTCLRKGTCNQYRTREHMPVYRRRIIAAEKERMATLEKQVPFFRKWLSVLLWLVLPSAIVSALSVFGNHRVSLMLAVVGNIVGGVCSLVYGIVLLRLASEEAGYRIAGIFTLIGAAMNLLYVCFGGSSWPVVWLLLMAVFSVIVSAEGTSCEMMSHGAILADLDDTLAGRWISLRNGYLIVSALMIVALFAILIAPVLGLLLLLASSLGLLSTGILKLVFLFQTVKRLQKQPV